MKFKRIFVIVTDSLGIGHDDEKAGAFGDLGANTFAHISEKTDGLNIPCLNSLGIADLDEIKGADVVSHPHSYSMRLHEASNGKDTMTGHWEMMGILTSSPFMTFTDTGFPKELIAELEKRTGRKVIGNRAASGTQIIQELGEQQCKEGSLIVYTSADSVLQIAANTAYIPLEELYRDCEIARELCLDPKYRVGRVIARPYIGSDASSFKRTSDRKDYALSPTGKTAMDVLKENGYMTSCVGKINDIFNGQGVSKTVHTTSDQNGMEITTEYVKSDDFEGLCFVNLVEFDSEYGHRRNPLGYGKHIEDFDRWLANMLKHVRDDDLVMITADHGNDPTWKGTDHTRELVPLICYSPSFKKGRKLADRTSFADIGETVLVNFGLKKADNMIGNLIEELLDEKD